VRRRLAGGAVVLLAATAYATDPIALRALFPKEADVRIDGPGLARLDLPPEVIAECLPSLADVRLFDLDGNEVPFLLDTPRVDAVFDAERVEPRVLDVRREQEPRENGPSLRRETFELSGPATAARGGAWKLVMNLDRSNFVAQAVVRWNAADSGTPGEASGSVFRLSSPRPVEKLSLSLAGSPIERVVVVLTHEQPYWLEPSFHFESSRTIDRVSPSTIPLSILSSHSANGVTVVELARPRGVVPATLRLGTQTPTFDRKVVVHDDGPGHGAPPLGSTSLFRLIPGSGVERLDLSLRAARGDRLRVVIDDGDSPPLTGLAFTAVFSQPSLVASLAGAGGSQPVAILRFGGGRASVPRYDLAGLRPELGREVFGERAVALLKLYDPATVRAATLGPARPNPAFDRAPALAFAMRPGAAIDTRTFGRRRTLAVQPSPEGLARLQLAPEDLAALRPDLADLRIVDAGSHQWPYLVERGTATVESPLAITASSKNRTTTYRLSSPVSPLTVDRIAVDTGVPFFDRPFTLSGEGEDGKEAVLAQGRFARRAGDPLPVTIELGTARVTRLTLRMDDGDDAPLTLSAVQARTPVPEVFVAAPEGSYTLLLGAENSAAPSYELARVRDVVLAVSAGDIRVQPIEANPGYRLSSRFTQGKGPEQALMWIAIVAAVLVLGVLTLRLARQSPKA